MPLTMPRVAGLFGLSEKIAPGVQLHQEFIAKRNPRLRAILRTYLAEKIDAKTQALHATIMLPCLLNEIFHLTNNATVEAICAAHIACDHFTQLFDDLADEQTITDKALLAHAGHTMLTRGRRLYLEISSEPLAFLELFEKTLEDVMLGEQWLWNRRGNVLPYDVRDFEMLRARGGIVNICLQSYCDASDNWHILPRLENALGNIAIGIQLLDDVVDVEADFKNGIFTAPLAAAIVKVGSSSSAAWPEVACELLGGNVWLDAIHQANWFLTKGYNELRSATEAFDPFFTELQTAIVSLRILIDEYRIVEAIAPAQRVSKILERRTVWKMQH